MTGTECAPAPPVCQGRVVHGASEDLIIKGQRPGRQVLLEPGVVYDLRRAGTRGQVGGWFGTVGGREIAKRSRWNQGWSMICAGRRQAQAGQVLGRQEQRGLVDAACNQRHILPTVTQQPPSSRKCVPAARLAAAPGAGPACLQAAPPLPGQPAHLEQMTRQMTGQGSCLWGPLAAPERQGCQASIKSSCGLVDCLRLLLAQLTNTD